MLHQKIMHHGKRLSPIIIIRINHRKWLMDQTLAGENCLSRSPGLRPSLRYRKSFRQLIQFLKSISHLTQFFHPIPNHFTKIFFQIPTDDKNNLIKPCFQSIVDGIIHNDLTAGAYRSQLLDPCAKSGSYPGRHNH